MLENEHLSNGGSTMQDAMVDGYDVMHLTLGVEQPRGRIIYAQANV
jgi:hypothetical protein